MVRGEGCGQQSVSCIEEGWIGRGDLQRRDEVILHPLLCLGERKPRLRAESVPKKGRIAFPQHRGPHFAGGVHFRVVAAVSSESDRCAADRLTVADVPERKRIAGHLR